MNYDVWDNDNKLNVYNFESPIVDNKLQPYKDSLTTVVATVYQMTGSVIGSATKPGDNMLVMESKRGNGQEGGNTLAHELGHANSTLSP
jgi:hypothetical protein